MSAGLNPPFGGELVSLIAPAARAAELQSQSRDWSSWDLTPRQLCDLELLLNGGFSPLRGFMSRRDYESSCRNMRLTNGAIWPIPVVLDVSEQLAKLLDPGRIVALREPEGVMLASLEVEEVWQPDRHAEAQMVYGTTSLNHPGVQYLLERTHPWYVAGHLEGICLPRHYDFGDLRLGPSELRVEFTRLAWDRIVAFQTRNPMHRAHQELTLQAAKRVGANLLIHPTVGMTKAGDIDYYSRVRCYKALLPNYPKSFAKLALLPLAMRMAGPREALWHAIIRKNFGCSHFIVGRDHAGPGSDENGTPFYAPYASQELLKGHQKEIGIQAVPFPTMIYLRDKDSHVAEDKVPRGSRVLSISGTELRERLAEGREIPPWFTFPEVARELERNCPPRYRQGFTVFFTGLSGSGKSTIANVLLVKLLELGNRSVTLLDGDVVRKHLSSELGFSREHRDINILRIGFVASEITKHGGIAICAPIAPFDAARKQVRAMITAHGGCVLVYLATPLAVCERRDRKGMYAKARAGLIEHFTGVSDPFEPPEDADIVVDTSQCTPEDVALEILVRLESLGFIRNDATDTSLGRETAIDLSVAQRSRLVASTGGGNGLSAREPKLKASS